MMLKSILIFFIFLLVAEAAYAQASELQVDRQKRFPYKQQVLLPAAMITVGAAMMWKGNNEFRWLPRTRVTIDDYLQYVPMLGMYAADIARVKARNNPWTQTKYLALSQLLCAVTVQTLKYTVREQRPNAGSHNSFPSGHTSVAFVGATVLYHEFKHTNKFLACSGFFLATAVGILRTTNQRHWMSDVVAGAGFGILSANLVYYFEPLKRWQPSVSDKRITLLPYYNDTSAGLSLSFALDGRRYKTTPRRFFDRTKSNFFDF
jgi:membrane-associated phospholipid phosphatase